MADVFPHFPSLDIASSKVDRLTEESCVRTPERHITFLIMSILVELGTLFDIISLDPLVYSRLQCNFPITSAIEATIGLCSSVFCFRHTSSNIIYPSTYSITDELKYCSFLVCRNAGLSRFIEQMACM